jgi:hypothetical protein
MRNAIVNAGSSPNQGYQRMPPEKLNNNGGTLGRAVVGVARTGAAQAGEIWTLMPGFALIGLTVGLLVATAPGLWPQLFAAQ